MKTGLASSKHTEGRKNRADHTQRKCGRVLLTTGAGGPCPWPNNNDDDDDDDDDADANADVDLKKDKKHERVMFASF